MCRRYMGDLQLRSWLSKVKLHADPAVRVSVKDKIKIVSLDYKKNNDDNNRNNSE